MTKKRRPKAWWRDAVKRWRRSGLSAEVFARHEGVAVGTLRWWSSQLGRDTRAEHGAAAGGTPIEIALPVAAVRNDEAALEIVVGNVIVRCPGGADAAYVAALVRALREQ